MIKPIQIRLSSKTQKSKLRGYNEDSFGQNVKHQFFILADGVGGSEGGNLASSFVVKKLSTYLSKSLDDVSYKGISEREAKLLLLNAIERVNDELLRENESQSPKRDSCTTVCVLMFAENKAICAHVGDSRIYLLRRNELLPLTRDHSLINDAIETGLLDQLDSTKTVKNVITKAVGAETKAFPTINAFSCHSKDIYLICSDGLTDVVEDEIIGELISEEDPLEKKVACLMDAANQGHSKDDVSIVLIEVLGFKDES